MRLTGSSSRATAVNSPSPVAVQRTDPLKPDVSVPGNAASIETATVPDYLRYLKFPWAPHGRHRRGVSRGRAAGVLPARGEPAQNAVLRGSLAQVLQALRVEPQLEVHGAALDEGQAVTEPVVAPVLGRAEADPRRADKAATDRHAVAEVRGQASAGRMRAKCPACRG